MPDPKKSPSDAVAKARVQRIQRKRARQSVVFGVLIAVMALSGLVAAAVYTEAISLPFGRTFSSDNVPVDKAVTPACLNGKKNKPVSYRKVNVRVFNASERGGLAATTANALEDRGFSIAGTGNSTTQVSNALIVYGVKGISRAYTLAAQLHSSVLVYDDRKGTSIDLIVGTQFEGLVDEDEVTIKAGEPMADLPGCAPVDTLVPATSTASTETPASD